MRPLIELLPQELHYENSPEMVSIQRALTAAMGDVWAARDGFAGQLFPATATWGLDAWEAALGLVPQDIADLNARRSAVIAKLRGAGTSTLERIRSVAEAQLGGEGWMREYPAEYRVEVGATAMAAPEGAFEALTAVLKEIMPAHLRWSYGLEYPATESALRLGGQGAIITTLPIPEAPDEMKWMDTLRIGGTGAMRSVLPVPERA